MVECVKKFYCGRTSIVVECLEEFYCGGVCRELAERDSLLCLNRGSV